MEELSSRVALAAAAGTTLRAFGCGDAPPPPPPPPPPLGDRTKSAEDSESVAERRWPAALLEMSPLDSDGSAPLLTAGVTDVDDDAAALGYLRGRTDARPGAHALGKVVGVGRAGLLVQLDKKGAVRGRVALADLADVSAPPPPPVARCTACVAR